MLTVSFDKVLSELTYGNLVMMCLHTVISSAFHPCFLGLTIVPIMSVIVNVLHSLFRVAVIGTWLCCLRFVIDSQIFGRYFVFDH